MFRLDRLFKWSLFLLLLIIFNSCNNQSSDEIEEVSIDSVFSQDWPLIPIPYDFDRLNLHLNAHYQDSNSNVEWVWNHMWSDNNIPDDSGIEYYENRKQDLFSFKGRKTLPTFFITTDKGRIIEFSAGTILPLYRAESGLKDEILERLVLYDLLQNGDIKKQVSDSLFYFNSTSEYEESIILVLPDGKRDQGSIDYTMKIPE